MNKYLKYPVVLKLFRAFPFKFFSNAYLSFFILSCFSCIEEEVGFDSLNYSGEDQVEIFVDGFISNESDFCRVKILKPMIGIKETFEFEPISSAQVSLLFKDKAIEFNYNDSLQSYESKSKVKGIPAIEYTLKIDLNDVNYTAKEQFPDFKENQIDMPFIRSELYDDDDGRVAQGNKYVELSIYEHNFGFNHFNIWQWVESNSSEIPLISLHDLLRISPFKVYSHKSTLPQGVFPGRFRSSGISGVPTDSVEIVQSFVSDEYREYLISVFNETNWRTSIFSTVAGNTKSNLSKGATGYFFALNARRYRTTLNELVQK
ncbi:hypothetical protein ABWH96_17300 [Marivirga tractuosa]|uniref:hypothetical protein n=1 Tax=Marivirga tractuosa TaxID=1006 RepID=UPI0035D007C1